MVFQGLPGGPFPTNLRTDDRRRALHPVFLTATGLAALAFLLSFGLVEIPLRRSIAPEPIGDTFQMPRDATSLAERIVMRMAAKENRWKVYERAAAQAGIAIEPDQLWMLARTAQQGDRHTTATLAKHLGLPEHQCKAPVEALIERGMAMAQPAGSIEFARREAELEHMLRDWTPKEHPEVRAKLASLAESFASSPPARPQGLRG
jgi:hypothetical protein